MLAPRGEAILHFLDTADWRRSLGQPACPQDLPYPGYRAVVTCFCSEEDIRSWLRQAGLRLSSLIMLAQPAFEGERRNWLAYCVRSD